MDQNEGGQRQHEQEAADQDQIHGGGVQGDILGRNAAPDHAAQATEERRARNGVAQAQPFIQNEEQPAQAEGSSIAEYPPEQIVARGQMVPQGWPVAFASAESESRQFAAEEQPQKQRQRPDQVGPYGADSRIGTGEQRRPAGTSHPAQRPQRPVQQIPHKQHHAEEHAHRRPAAELHQYVLAPKEPLHPQLRPQHAPGGQQDHQNLQREDGIVEQPGELILRPVEHRQDSTAEPTHLQLSRGSKDRPAPSYGSPAPLAYLTFSVSPSPPDHCTAWRARATGRCRDMAGEDGRIASVGESWEPACGLISERRDSAENLRLTNRRTPTHLCARLLVIPVRSRLVFARLAEDGTHRPGNQHEELASVPPLTGRGPGHECGAGRRVPTVRQLGDVSENFHEDIPRGKRGEKSC